MIYSKLIFYNFETGFPFLSFGFRSPRPKAFQMGTYYTNGSFSPCKQGHCKREYLQCKQIKGQCTAKKRFRHEMLTHRKWQLFSSEGKKNEGVMIGQWQYSVSKLNFLFQFIIE